MVPPVVEHKGMYRIDLRYDPNGQMRRSAKTLFRLPLDAHNRAGPLSTKEEAQAIARMLYQRSWYSS